MSIDAPERVVSILGPTATEVVYGSNLSNYGDYYNEWDDDDNRDTCPDCRGTGMDKWEEYECATCGGEGDIPWSAPLTRR